MNVILPQQSSQTLTTTDEIAVWTIIKKIVLRPSVLTFFGLFSLYYILYGSKFLSNQIVLGGDTQLLWSSNYLFYYSIKNYGEFAWWDPSGLNGWPIYYFLTAGGYNLLAPFSFLASVFFIILNFFIDIDINKFLTVQHTLYYFGLSLIAVILISRQLVKKTLAQIFIPLTFTLGSIPFGFFRDSYMAVAFPAALFYIFGLIQFDQKRNSQSFYLFVLFTILFLSSLCYSVALSSLYWTSLFSLTLFLFSPNLFNDLITILKNEFKSPEKNKIFIIVACSTAIIAVVATLLPVMIHSTDFIRTPGSLVDYADKNSGWHPPTFGAPSYQIWRVLLAWMPLRELHDTLFLSDIWKSGIDHWYIGMTTLPLIIIAFIFANKKLKYLLALLLTAFLCIVVIPYTYKNLLFLELMKKFKFFHDVRTMPGLLPRDGPLLFLIFIAGIGLDRLLLLLKSSNDVSRKIFSISLLFGLIILGSIAISQGMSALLPGSSYKMIRHGLTHLGIYLIIFSFICSLMILSKSSRHKKILGIFLLILVINDLTTSSSQYWREGKVWSGKMAPNALHDPKSFGPTSTENEHWAQGYAGVFHNILMNPFYGDKTWLTLVSRPKIASDIENWNAKTRRVIAYPFFRYFTHGNYIPFKNIIQIDNVKLPKKGDSWFYLHNEALEDNQRTPKPLDVKQKINSFSLNKIEMTISSEENGYMVFYDNFNPFWQAKINGQKVPIYRANFSFKTIQIPAGDSTVEWEFNPYPIKILWILFYISLFGFLFCFYYFFKSKDNG